MSKPAARIGDMTAHGGSIVAGMPTVLIGGMPAARLGDMHVCPMATPAVPPVPHVGGPVTLGSAGVMIGGMPAARMGDMCVCTGPPDSIAMGCPTVLIGEVGAGSAGGGGGGGGGAGGARASAAAATIDTGVSTTKEEHWIEFEFVDSAGLPVSGVPYTFTDPDGVEREGTLRTDGTIRADGVSEGEGSVILQSVHAAQWDTDRASTDDKLTLTAEVIGFDDGTPAQVQIFERDLQGADSVVADVKTNVKNGSVEVKWRYEYPPDTPKGDELRAEDTSPDVYSAPDYYFEVIVGTCAARSPALLVVDTLEIDVQTESGDPVANQPYVLVTGTGERRTGTLDRGGEARERNIPVSDCIVRIPELPDLKTTSDSIDLSDSPRSGQSEDQPSEDRGSETQIQVLGLDGEPAGHIEYTIRLGNEVISGTTDRSGWTQPFDPGGETEGELETKSTLGRLTFDPPSSKIQEAQGYLNAAGFGPVPVNGELQALTRMVVKSYQKAAFLPETGELDDLTLQSLRQQVLSRK